MTLSLNPVVNIEVYISPLAAPRRTFNQGLIIGSTAVIPITERIRQYTDADSMLEDGFTNASPEYLAAQKYFSQIPKAIYLWIGRLDAVASKLSAVAVNAGGSGYVVGDILTVVQSGGSGGQVRVSTVSSGVVTAVTIYAAGTGYATATGRSTTGGHGTGCTLDISAVRAETTLEAVQACRVAGADWYLCTIAGPISASDAEAVAAYVESATPTTRFFFETIDTDVLNDVAGNVFKTLKAAEYNRTFGIYSTVTYAASAAVGRAMGLTTGLAGSAYTMKFKRLIGITAENLTNTQVTNIESDNGNLYVNRGAYYNMLEQGVMSDGSFFDEGIFLDMLVNNMQLNVMDLLYSTPKVPQTDVGVTSIMHQVNRACDQAVMWGFIAPGVWNGSNVLNLKTGDTLPAGYLTQAQALKDQSQADREARKAPPIYCCIKEAGAVHSVVIGLYVNR